jgi:hypothetical protein
LEVESVSLKTPWGPFSEAAEADAKTKIEQSSVVAALPRLLKSTCDATINQLSIQ